MVAAEEEVKENKRNLQITAVENGFIVGHFDPGYGFSANHRVAENKHTLLEIIEQWAQEVNEPE